MPLKLPRLQINNYNTGRILSVKFLGVLLVENLLWKDYIKYAENKIFKNIGIWHKQEIIWRYTNADLKIFLYVRVPIK